MHKAMLTFQYWNYSRYRERYGKDLSFTEAVRAFPSRNALHSYMHHYFHHLGPAGLRDHRRYFSYGQRGFGEDAFHAMWWVLLREFKPRMCLEIGVYRGQVISLWATVGALLKIPIDVHGISPFQSVGDAVSRYRHDIDYLADTLASFRHLGLPAPTLVHALSTDATATEHIDQRLWDLVYVDGNHDYEVAVADYRRCRDHLRVGGLLVLDDASLNTDFSAPLFSFKGHPGPSRVAKESAMTEMKFLGAVGHNNIFAKI